MGLDHSDHIFGTILDVYAAAGSTRTNDFIDNSRPCDHNRKLCGSSHITPKFVTISLNGFGFMYINSQNIFLNIILAPLFHVVVELFRF